LKFLFIYHGGQVPEDRMEQNMDELWRWLDELRDHGYESVRFAGNGRKTVTASEIGDYEGDVFGISVIEAESLEKAVSLTANWPEWPYGGKIEIFEAL